MSNVEWLEFLRMKVRNGRDLGFESLVELGDIIAVNEGDLWQLQVMAGLAHSEILSLRRQRDDLHEANNRYLDRARAAEAEIRRRDEKTEDTKQRVQQGLRDKVTSSSDLADTIADLGKFIDMIEARAMAVDGPVTPFCEELHAASVAEKERFQEILGKLYQFRKCWVKKPLVTPEWVQKKAALEDGRDPTTGLVDNAVQRAWQCMGTAFEAMKLPNPNMYVADTLLIEIAVHFDSLDFAEMLLEIEKTSGVLIDEAELPDLHECTIGDIAQLLTAKMAKAGAA